MDRPSKKKIIGILGGIGSGKSSAAAEFQRLGCGVVSADDITSEFLCDSEVIDKLVKSFGIGILDKTGCIDRASLAEIVFDDADKVSVIKDIIHPEVFKRTEALIKEFNNNPDIKAIVLDMPLLVEVGWHRVCNKLIFVACDKSIRLERIQKSGKMSKNQLEKRENFQIPLDKKASIADTIVNNNSGHSDLVRQIEDIFTKYFG